MDKVLELIKAARAIISDKKKWCTECYALDCDGNLTNVPPEKYDKEPVQWSVTGAVLQATQDLNASPSEFYAVMREIDAVAEHLAGGTFAGAVAFINDIRGHKEVLYMLDIAIKKISIEGDKEVYYPDFLNEFMREGFRVHK